MIVVQGWSVAVVVLCCFITVGWAQDPTPDPEAPPPQPPGPGPLEGPSLGDKLDDKANGFIVPEEHHDNLDIFAYGAQEYVVVNRKRRWRNARIVCSMEFHGQLALIDNHQKAMFMAEALSETNLVFDALWIGGAKDDNTTDWKWRNGNKTATIDPELVKNFSKVNEVEADNRDCLAFARLDHDLPDYRSLSCNAERAILCERARGGGGGNSTHPGWIKLGKRLYKIYSELVSYEMAQAKCFQHDPDAQLAVIVNFNFSQLLGRYLLISRPSLENAWIGAKWIETRYKYEPEPIELANTSSDFWPPWRGGRIQKKGGCILLDRHLANITLFVEARCERSRGYICYKFDVNGTGNESFTDIIIGENGYRLHFHKRTWKAARDFCLNAYSDYGAYLSEILSLDTKNDLLYVMGENRTTVQHIWLGAQLSEKEPKTWMWDKEKSAVNQDILDWVKNDTYNAEAEEVNTCLDMDRENHITALHYGTNCESYQNFVCSFTKAKLLELIEFERQTHARANLE